MENLPGPSVGSSSSSSPASRGAGIDNKKRTKKARHRPRSKNNKEKLAGGAAGSITPNNIDSSEASSELMTFTIEAISDNTGRGTLFRRRNPFYKHVNIKSFIKSKPPPYVCVTKFDDEEIRGKFNDLLTLTNTNNNNHNRKYRNADKVSTRKWTKRQQNGGVTRFNEYLTYDQVTHGLKQGDLIEGVIRINPKNPNESYVTNMLDRTKSDYLINGIPERNRALEGDRVVLEKLLIKNNGTTTNNNRWRVVYILKKVHDRSTIGFLVMSNQLSNDSRYAEFIPRDCRFPRMRIPATAWPNGFATNPNAYKNLLFCGKLIEWNQIGYGIGTITENIGLCGDLKAETVAILREFNLDTRPFDSQNQSSIIITADEIKMREDRRKDCIFTIDPLTARDLDDAMSCKLLSNGNYEIGVHISDVTNYIEENSQLDQIVRNKATTIYLVDSVYHMLPDELCMHCSLLPGQDKLAFSVFWEFTKSGEILSKRIAKTVINSCAQLAYEHAQIMIDNNLTITDKWELPNILNGFTATDLSNTVNNLQHIALKLRADRIKNGALRIDQIKLLFALDPATGRPQSFRTYENMAAHRLIEEFMLLANITVAEFIVDRNPSLAFLRRHGSPKPTMLDECQRNLESVGIHIDVSSSGAISTSLAKYDADDFLAKSRMIVLNNMFAKPMVRAEYFCASQNASGTDFTHYALSVPIYTHFTSPIRRYADIVVHRLVAASLDNSCYDSVKLSANELAAIADNCNIQKYQAKCAGEASSDLYLAHFVETNQPYIQRAVVIDVRERSIDAIVLNTGTNIRINLHNLRSNDVKWKVQKIDSHNKSTTNNISSENDKRIYQVLLNYIGSDDEPDISIVLEMFSIITVKLKRKAKTNKLEAELLKPIQQYVFEKPAESVV